MIRIDGSSGEGGGQVLRASLALSMCTGQPFEIDNIRARRKKPGLLRQHLTAVRAAARICSARMSPADLGTTTLRFEPGPVHPDTYHFAIGTAGSTTLVLQAILPPLLTASGPSTIVLEGGTHNPMAPPFPFLVHTVLPLLERLGPRVHATLERPGFFPAGGGKLRIDIEPVDTLEPLELDERGKILRRQATAILAQLPDHIAERELDRVRQKLGWNPKELAIERMERSAGPGNVLVLRLDCEHVTETFIGFGQRGVRAEQVADRTIRQLRHYANADVPVGEYLADQLLLPLALAGGGRFTTFELSGHTTTQIELIPRFLDIPIEVHALEKGHVQVVVGQR